MDEDRPMFMEFDMGLTNVYLAKLADRCTPICTGEPVTGGENIEKRHASTGR